MSFGLAISLISLIYSFEESSGGFGGRFKWMFSLFSWGKMVQKSIADDLNKGCIKEFIKNTLKEHEYHLFSEDDIKKICDDFLGKYPKISFDKMRLKKFLEDFNERRLLSFSPPERMLHNEIKKGNDDVKKAVDCSKNEIMNAFANEQQDDCWEKIIQGLNDSNCNLSDFGIKIVGKCNGCLEKVMMLFPSIVNTEKKEKYELLFRQCCSETGADRSYEILVSALSKNFDEYVNLYKGLNGYRYSSQFLQIVKKSRIAPNKETNLDSIVDLILQGLNECVKWDDENSLSEYVEFFFDNLTNEQIIKLADPYIIIFVDKKRQESNPYDSKKLFKNKEIAKKVVERLKLIPNWKTQVVYPVLKREWEDLKRRGETKRVFRNRMWRNNELKLKDLDVKKTELSKII